MNTSKVVYAVIVTYNPEMDLLNKQFSSLIDQVDGLVYVDNKSKEECLKLLPSQPNIHLVYNDSNLGLAKAQNQGIKLAKEHGATHVLLMDQDSLASEHMVEYLLAAESKYLDKNIRVGLVGPLIRDVLSNPPKVAGALVFKGLSFNRIAPDKETMEVSYCIASGSLIAVETFTAVGLMDERLFIDSLDLEWCFRAKAKGYEILLEPNAVLDHQLGNGEDHKILSHSPIREYYICRNSMIIAKYRHIPLGYRIRKFIFTPLRVFSAMVGGHTAHFESGLKGFWDGLRFRK